MVAVSSESQAPRTRMVAQTKCFRSESSSRFGSLERTWADRKSRNLRMTENAFLRALNSWKKNQIENDEDP